MSVFFILSIIANIILIPLVFILHGWIQQMHKIWNETHKSLLDQDAEIVEIDGKKFKNAKFLVEIKE